MAFVTFNKVLTSQYYLWYNTLVPMIFMHSDLKKKFLATLGLTALYYLGQLPFGFFAYRFEYLGEQTLSQIQYTNYMWFSVNVFIMLVFIAHHNLNVTK